MKRYVSFVFFLTSVWTLSYAQIPLQEFALPGFYESSGLMGGGAAVIDFNNDGWEDIYVVGGIQRDLLYQNNGDGSFTEVGEAAGIGFTAQRMTFGVNCADFDNDGYRDLFIATGHLWGVGFQAAFDSMDYNILLKNNGDGTFTDQAQAAGIHSKSWSMTATLGDVNLDGLLDLYVVNYVDTLKVVEGRFEDIVAFEHDCYPDQLYINQGNFQFKLAEDRIDLIPACGLAAAFSDYDGDADPDLIVANDFGEWIQPNQLFNNENGHLTDVAPTLAADIPMFGMGVTVGDYDNDLDLDYYFTNIGKNYLLQQQTDHSFLDVSEASKTDNTFYGDLYTTSWGSVFSDIDLDGDQDLLVANGYMAMGYLPRPTTPVDPNQLLINQGDGTFTNESETSLFNNDQVSRGMVRFDFDHDGDEDYFVVMLADSLFPEIENATHHLLYENQTMNNHHWLRVKCEGSTSNKDGIGVQIKLIAGDLRMMREIGGGGPYCSQNSNIAHFGLAQNNTIDSLIINWPGGHQQVFTQIYSKQLLTIKETDLSTTIKVQTEDKPIISPTILSQEERLYIQLNQNNRANETIQIWDLTGKIVYQTMLHSSISSLPIDQLGQGLFLVVLINNKGIFHQQKIMVY